MAKKAGIRTRTFEEFKGDNKQYYNTVYRVFSDMLIALNKGGTTTEKIYGIDMLRVQLGSDNSTVWHIEGNVNTADLGDDESKTYEVHMHNYAEKVDIMIEYSATAHQTYYRPSNYTNPDEYEYEIDDNIDSITFYENDGDFDYVIAVTKDIEELVKKIIKIAY